MSPSDYSCPSGVNKWTDSTQQALFSLMGKGNAEGYEAGLDGLKFGKVEGQVIYRVCIL